MSSGFCPRCGQPRVGSFRFCRSCGLDLDSVTEGAAPPPAYVPSPAPTPPAVVGSTPAWVGTTTGVVGPAVSTAAATNVRGIVMGAGASWLICGALTAYLALLQLGFAGASSDVATVGLWNAIASVTFLYFGARILIKPTRGWLMWSLIWAVVNVLWSGYQVTLGATHWAFVGSVVAALVAGVLSLMARSDWVDA